MEEPDSDPDAYKQKTALIKALELNDYQEIYRLLKGGYVANNNELLYILQTDEPLSDIIALRQYDKLTDFITKNSYLVI